MTAIERRHFPRHPLHKRGVVVFPMACLDVSFLDISANGVLVEAIDARGFPMDALCSLGTLGAEDRQVLVVDAIVVRCMEGRCVGLKFRNISPGAQKALRQLIEMNLQSKALIQRDPYVLLKSSDSARQPPAAAY